MANSTMDQPEGHERRVRNVLNQARREVSARDLVTFSFGRMWAVVLELGAVVFVLFGRWQNHDVDE